jgi:hypothetical protein
MLQRQGVGLATGTTVVGAVVALLWIIVIWGAFSDAHKLNRWRSTVGFLIAIILWVPVGAFVFVVAYALIP